MSKAQAKTAGATKQHPDALVTNKQGEAKPLRAASRLKRNNERACWGKPASLPRAQGEKITTREKTKLKRTAVVHGKDGAQLKEVAAHTRWLDPEQKTPEATPRVAGERISRREGDRWIVDPPPDDEAGDD